MSAEMPLILEQCNYSTSKRTLFFALSSALAITRRTLALKHHFSLYFADILHGFKPSNMIDKGQNLCSQTHNKGAELKNLHSPTWHSTVMHMLMQLISLRSGVPVLFLFQGVKKSLNYFNFCSSQSKIVNFCHDYKKIQNKAPDWTGVQCLSA